MIRSHSRSSLSLLLFILVACSLYGRQNDVPSRIKRFENGLLPPVVIKGKVETWNILDRMKHYNVPGISVAVFYDNKVQWAKGYGVKDNDTEDPVTPQTLFVAGSISKPIAVMGALKLVDEGKLALDENINTFLKSWKLPENDLTATHPVTLRLLVSHNAGVTVHGFRGYAVGEGIPTIIQTLDGTAPANSPPIRVDIEPGKQWRYSGGGITIMQLAMTDVTGETFPEIERRRVLEPIGMTSSSYEQTLSPDRLKLAASGHYADGKVIEGKRFVYPEMAAAGLWTTPTDLCKAIIEAGLAARGKSNKVLPQDLASLMVNGRISTGGKDDMALGFFVEHRGKALYFGHNGADVGFIAMLTSHREAGYGAAIMVNADARAFGLIDEVLRSIAQEYGWEDYVQQHELVTRTADELKPYEGRYRAGSDDILKVWLEGNRLMAKNFDAQFELLATSDGSFIRMDSDVSYVFGPPSDGRSSLVTFESPHDRRSVQRIPDDEMVPLEFLLDGKTAEATRGYKEIARKNPGDESVNEARLNNLGYRFLGQDKFAEAIAVFTLNADLYPKSWNVYDSLGEAYMKSGNKELAIANYEKSIALDPKNENGKKILEELRKK